MKTWRSRYVAVGVLAIAVFAVGASGVIEPAWAQARGGGGGGGHGGAGGWHGGGGSHGRGSHGGGWRGGSHWHGGHWDGGWRGSVFIGGPFWYPYGYAYPYWDPYPAYPWGGVVVESVPQVYIQREPAPEQYWYYCQDPPRGYYPDVQACPSGWLRVAPRQNQPAAPG